MKENFGFIKKDLIKHKNMKNDLILLKIRLSKTPSNIYNIKFFIKKKVLCKERSMLSIPIMHAPSHPQQMSILIL